MCVWRRKKRRGSEGYPDSSTDDEHQHWDHHRQAEPEMREVHYPSSLRASRERSGPGRGKQPANMVGTDRQRYTDERSLQEQEAQQPEWWGKKSPFEYYRQVPSREDLRRASMDFGQRASVDVGQRASVDVGQRASVDVSQRASMDVGRSSWTQRQDHQRLVEAVVARSLVSAGENHHYQQAVDTRQNIGGSGSGYWYHKRRSQDNGQAPIAQRQGDKEEMVAYTPPAPSRQVSQPSPPPQLPPLDLPGRLNVDNTALLPPLSPLGSIFTGLLDTDSIKEPTTVADKQQTTDGDKQQTTDTNSQQTIDADFQQAPAYVPPPPPQAMDSKDIHSSNNNSNNNRPPQPQ
ncbi:hypothetical protein BGX31_003087, partial [Mortierella sp. GBA43]